MTQHLDLANSTFSEFYKLTPEKYFGIFGSVLNIFSTPVYYSVYWYMRNCSNKERSLIHYLALSSCLCGVAYNLFQSTLEIFVTLFQPMNYLICSWNIICRNVIAVHFLCLLGTNSVVKYVYIFIYKNPVGAYDEFWCLFINLAFLQWQLIFQTVDFITISKKFYGYYICTNTLPELGSTIRLSLPFYVPFILSILANLAIEVKVKQYKRQEKKIMLMRTMEQKKKPSYRLEKVIENFVYSICGFFMIALGLGLPSYVSRLKIEFLNEVTFLVFFQVHWLPFIMMTVLVFAYIVPNKKMTTLLKKEIKSRMESLRMRF